MYNDYKCFSPKHYNYQSNSLRDNNYNFEIGLSSFKPSHNYQNSMFSTSSLLSGNSTTILDYQNRSNKSCGYNYQINNEDSYYRKKMIQEIREDYRRNNRHNHCNFRSGSGYTDLTSMTHSILQNNNSYISKANQEFGTEQNRNIGNFTYKNDENDINNHKERKNNDYNNYINQQHNLNLVNFSDSDKEREIKPITEETKSFQEENIIEKEPQMIKEEKELLHKEETHLVEEINENINIKPPEINEVKENVKESEKTNISIKLPEKNDIFPVPQYKYISSLEELSKYSKDEKIKRLYHNNLFLYEELSSLKKENELLKKELLQKKEHVKKEDNKEKEEQNDKFKNHLIEENDKLNKINKTNEKIIEGLLEQINRFNKKKKKDNISYTELKENADNLEAFFVEENKKEVEEKNEVNKKINRNAQNININPICTTNGTNNTGTEFLINNKTITISSTNREEDEINTPKPKIKKSKLKKKKNLSHNTSKNNLTITANKMNNVDVNNIETIQPIKKKKTKSKSKTKKIKQISNLELGDEYNTIEGNQRQFWDYYNENKADRTKTCYACLFGINNYTKGYSPLLCSPHRQNYILQRKGSKSSSKLL